MVGYGKNGEWDDFYLWMVDALRPYADAETAPRALLDEMVKRMLTLVEIEGRVQSRLSYGLPNAVAGSVQSVSASPVSSDMPYEDFTEDGPPLEDPAGDSTHVCAVYTPDRPPSARQSPRARVRPLFRLL